MDVTGALGLYIGSAHGTYMQIREFNLELDYEIVRALWREAGSGIQLSPSDEQGEISKKLNRDPDLFLVAEEGKWIVGAVLGGFDGRRGMVYHLAVQPEYRERGIGRALMDELEHRLRAKGCLKYYLLVTKDNQEALAFYRQMGCDEMELLVMGKKLS
jgi:ribosomal protein S18 acetylase RimI-like enzyme